MTPIQRWTSVLLALTVLSGDPTAWAQATFSVSSTAATVIRTGHAEPVGGLTFAVVSGTTVAEGIAIDLSPAVLTSDATDISTSPAQTGFSATVDRDAGRVALHVPAGIGPGTVVHLEGLRVSVPASGIETLDARISTVENRLTTRSRVAQVIAGVADAIVIDPSTDPVYTYNSGRVLVDHLGHFTFSEGFAAAFSDGTQIIFQASPLPRNTQLRFPATIESQTGARLTTADGADVTLASGGSRNRVVYTFAPGASSRSAVDVFSFSPVLERTGPVGAGTGFYQVTIGPIGAAKPTRALPSTVVPRYEELLLPVLGPDLPASKTFLFPVERGVDTQSFTVSNTATGAAPLTIRAFDEAGGLLDGSDVANDRAHLLAARQTLTFDLGTMFGPGATAVTVASVAIESKNDRPVATKIGTTAGGAYAVHSQAPVEPAYFPFDRRSAGEMPLVSVAGAGAADFESRWTLMDTAGVEQASAVREAGAGGAVRDSLDALFGITAAAVPLAGYVRVESIEAQFRGNLVDNPGEGTLAVPALGATGSRWTVYPYFVIGGGYNTVVTLINASDETAAVTATAFDADGAKIAPGFTTRISPQTMEELDWAAILGTGSLRQGYFALDVVQADRPHPFVSVPHLAGVVRIEAPGSRVAMPLTNEPGDEFFFTPVRSDEDEYTGLSILNEGQEEMEVLIEAYAGNGELLDAAELLVAGRATRIGLLREFLPDLGSADGGYVRVTSTSIRMRALALRGRMDGGTGLLHLAAQTAP